MSEEIKFDGITYASLRRAALETNLSHDYLSRLCRKKILDARREESGWYVNVASIKAYILAQEHANEFRRKDLARQRANEYDAKRGVQAQKAFADIIAAESDHMPSVSAAREQVRRVLEPAGGALSSLSEGARMPGMLQAAAQIPAQAMAHMPTHVVTPAMDMIHRVVALAFALVLVLGTYSLFDPVFARMTYDSARAGVASVEISALHVSSGASTASAAMSVALGKFAQDPSIAVVGIQSTIDSSYRSALALASRISMPLAQSREPSMAASAAIATVQPAEPQPVAVLPVAQAQVAAAASAQTPTASEPVGFTQPVAIAVKFSGNTVAYGDIISYDPDTKLYTLAHGANDAAAYGVVAEDPALVFKPDEASNISVTRSGPTLMNVTLENGPIAVGDLLTTSSIPGKARRAKDGEHIVGTAAEPFATGGVVLDAPDGTKLASGTIKVNVTIGASAPGQSSAEQTCTSLSCRVSGSIDMQVVRALVRYLLSGVIAALTLTLAFKSFMSDANYGVISMGRNPRAKSSIQSMVVFNAVLTLAIASAGLFAAMIVLFAG
ncbi:MAG: hypothetical protein JWM46_277 [Candidatus Kaiserbacteria bacterium]|nr:hypothetical protein [Candidatus Kaiserbacteria bacterium]